MTSDTRLGSYDATVRVWDARTGQQATVQDARDQARVTALDRRRLAFARDLAICAATLA